jgi:excisionase family DNA binding protein
MRCDSVYENGWCQVEIAVREAAERLGISEPRVRQLLASGDLAGRRLAEISRVTAAA